MSQSSRQSYAETVLAPRWMMLAGAGVALLGGIAGVSSLANSELPRGDRLASGLAALVAAALVMAVALIFTRLRIEASDAEVRFGFGPFASRLPLERIEGASAERYRWLRFGGWGLRWSWGGRDRAYSVPFVNRGVEIRLLNGRTFFVSSRHPETLAQAINALRGRSDGILAL